MDIQLPDGRVLTGVPEGTTKAQIAERLGLPMGAQQKPEQQEQGLDYNSPTLPAKVLANAASSGLYNEAMGAIATPLAYIGSKFTDSPMTIGQAYEKSMSQANNLDKERKDFAEQNPITNVAMELAPMVGSYATLMRKTPYAAEKIANLLRSGNVIKRAGTAGALGGASSGLYEAATAEPGKRVDAGLRGSAFGLGAGAALPVAGSGLRGIGEAIRPSLDPVTRQVAQKASEYGIPLSVDQIAGSRVRNLLQNISRSMPLSGDDAFRSEQLGAYNRAISNTIGQDSDKITPEVMDKAFSDVGKMFDDVGAGQTIPIGPNFTSGVSQIKRDIGPLHTADASGVFDNYVNKVIESTDETGNITGEALSRIRSDINKAARTTSVNGASDMLRELEGVVIDSLSSGDPARAAQIQEAKKLYRNLVTVEPLAQKAVEGNISPALLAGRVSQNSGRAYTKGKAGELGDLARIGRDLLRINDGSDTLNKALLASTVAKAVSVPAAGAAALVDLGSTATALGANRAYQSLYNRNPSVVSKILSGSDRPQISKNADMLIKALTGK